MENLLLRLRAEGPKVYENVIHSLARDGSVQAVHYGFDPAVSRVWIQDIEGPRLEFAGLDDIEGRTPRIQLNPFEYYGGWWAAQIRIR